jgi:hypothetical protein
MYPILYRTERETDEPSVRRKICEFCNQAISQVCAFVFRAILGVIGNFCGPIARVCGVRHESNCLIF